jgi:hypothetical protein
VVPWCVTLIVGPVLSAVIVPLTYALMLAIFYDWCLRLRAAISRGSLQRDSSPAARGLAGRGAPPSAHHRLVHNRCRRVSTTASRR